MTAWIELQSVGSNQRLYITRGDYWIRIGGTQPADGDRGLRLTMGEHLDIPGSDNIWMYPIVNDSYESVPIYLGTDVESYYGYLLYDDSGMLLLDDGGGIKI